MKNKIIAFILLLTLASCDRPIMEKPYHDALTQFIIKDIKQLKGMKLLTTYYVEVVDVNDLSSSSSSSGENLKFIFCDTIGKYKLGQPIHFDKNR